MIYQQYPTVFGTPFRADVLNSDIAISTAAQAEWSERVVFGQVGEELRDIAKFQNLPANVFSSDIC